MTNVTVHCVFTFLLNAQYSTISFDFSTFLLIEKRELVQHTAMYKKESTTTYNSLMEQYG